MEKPAFGAVPSTWEPSVFSVIRRMRALPDLGDRLARDPVAEAIEFPERLDREDIELLLAGPPANCDEETRRRWRQALWRLTAGMGLFPRKLSRDSSTKSAPELREQQRIYNSALTVGAKAAYESRRVRIGTKWVTDERGRARPIIPAEELMTKELWRFLRARGFSAIPGGFKRGTREANSGRTVQPAPPEEQLATPMPDEEPGSIDPAVGRLLEKTATPRQKAVFRLLREGFTLKNHEPRPAAARALVFVEASSEPDAHPSRHRDSDRDWLCARSGLFLSRDTTPHGIEVPVCRFVGFVHGDAQLRAASDPVPIS
jgi:hypothetical protein